MVGHPAIDIGMKKRAVEDASPSASGCKWLIAIPYGIGSVLVTYVYITYT
jgi:hypothetical protein